MNHRSCWHLQTINYRVANSRLHYYLTTNHPVHDFMIDFKKNSWFWTNNFETEFLILDHCVKGRFCAQFGQKSLAPSSFDDRFKMHSICFAPFWLLLPFSTAHQMIRTFFFHSLRLGFWQTNYCNVNLKKWDIQIFLILKFSDLRTQYRTHILVWKYI